MTSIDSLLASVSSKKSIVVPGSWGQGRTVFGGLSAALINQAMCLEVGAERLMRIANVQFIGPLLVDTPFEIVVSHLRDGKNVTQLQGQIIQNSQVAVMVVAVFGAGRPSKISVPLPKKELKSPIGKPTWLPAVPKLVPNFLSYIEMKFEEGGVPFTGRKTSHYQGWMRYKTPPVIFSDVHCIALIDAWPSAVIQMLKWPAPASTISWNLEFLHPQPTLLPTDWLHYRCDTRQACDGYVHTEATIYAPDGTALALSRQVDAVFG